MSEPKQRPVLVIGVDPAMHLNAFAWGMAGGVPSVASFDGLVQIARCTVLKQLSEAHAETHELYAIIECPTWSGRGTKEVRSATVQWESELQRLFPKRRVFRVDPGVWQRMMLAGIPGQSTKDRALYRARQVLRIPVTDHNEADALCVWEYGDMLAQGLVAPEQRRAAEKIVNHDRHQRSGRAASR